MIVTTTPNIEGKSIIEYKGLCFSQVTRGVGAIRSISAGLKATFGTRSKSNESSIEEVRTNALNEIIQNAREMGANAIIGLSIDIEMIADNQLCFCKMYGTAVVIQ